MLRSLPLMIVIAICGLAGCGDESAGVAADAGADLVNRPDRAIPGDALAPATDGPRPDGAALDAEADAAVDATRDTEADAAVDATRDTEADAAPVLLPPYGTAQLVVDATHHGTNTELFLQAGETATLSASGSWSTWPGVYPATGPEGDPAFELDGCPIGSLVAQVGLEWEGGTVHCIGAAAQLTASQGGIVFLRINDGVVEDNSGSMTVTVTSSGARAPVIAASQVASYDLAAVSAEQIELAGAHVLLTLPRDLVLKYQQQAAQALAAFDDWYAAQQTFVGFAPYNGDPIRYFPDDSITPYGYYMISGNPIRFSPAALDGAPGGHAVLQVHRPGDRVWPFPHEMAHDFTVYLAGGRYMIGPGPVEAWANVVNIRALQQTGFAEGTRQYPFDWQNACTGLAQYLASGSYAQFRDDPWLPLCMLLEIKDQYGWTLFEDFFADLQAIDLDTVPSDAAPDIDRWSWLRDRLNALSGADLTPILAKYKVPLS